MTPRGARASSFRARTSGPASASSGNVTKQARRSIDAPAPSVGTRAWKHVASDLCAAGAALSTTKRRGARATRAVPRIYCDLSPYLRLVI